MVEYELQILILRNKQFKQPLIYPPLNSSFKIVTCLKNWEISKFKVYI